MVDYLEREFETAVLRKFHMLQEDVKKQYNNLTKTLRRDTEATFKSQAEFLVRKKNALAKVKT